MIQFSYYLNLGIFPKKDLLNYLFYCPKILSGDSGNFDKLYFFNYKGPNKVSERVELSISKDEDEVGKLSETAEFEAFMKKMGFYQRYQKR